MNSRVRALVWEELRVGGPIVGLILTIGVLLLVYMRADWVMASYGTWPELAEYCLTVVVGAPLLCSLLLVLNIRNSGHLGGGFSRRILRMPVDTRAAVTVPLLIRLGWIVTLSLTLFAVCRLLYHEGPGWRGVLVLAGVYLMVQVLDWTRAVAAWSVLALALAVAALVVEYTGNWVLLPDLVAGVSRTSAPLFLAGFGCVAGLSYAASLAVVRWTRLGKRIDPSTGTTLAEVVGWRGSYGEGVFSSPQAAQFWYEMRKTRLLLPKSACLFWLLGTVGYWLYHFLEHYGPNGMRPATSELLAGPFVTEALPLAALLFAAMVWRMQTSWSGWRESRQSVSGWAARHPVTKAQAARARLAVAGLNLAVALGMASALYMTAFLLADEAAVPRLLGDAWSMGATSPREIAALLLGPVLLAGLLAWIVMHLPAAMAGLAAALFLGGVGDDLVVQFLARPLGIVYYGLLFRPKTEEYLWALILSFPVILFLASLVTVLCLGWVRRRSAFLCLAAWAGLALALYPFAVRVWQSEVDITVGYCLCIAALAVMCWPQTVLRCGGGLRTALRPEDRHQHRRTAAMVPLGRRALLAVSVLAVLGGVAWMRWPAEPATTAMRRSQGVPANLAELNAWYKEVPEEENLALRYRDAKSIVEPLNTAWLRSRGITLPPRLRYNSEAMANVLVQGAAKVSRTQVIPQAVWADTKSYWDMAGLPVAAKLHAVARSGLSNSRYWIDLRQGPATLMEHLAPLRNLARILSVEGWVAAVERRPHDAATAVLDTFPIANSLAEEPVLLSQLVRAAIVGMAVANLETVLNRCEMPEEELVRVQAALATELPPLGESPFLNRALTAEECFSLALTKNPVSIWQYSESPISRSGLYRSFAGRALARTAMELMGIGRLDRAVMARQYKHMRETGGEAAKHGVLPDVESMGLPNTERLVYHAPVSSTTLPGMARFFEAEWRARTQLDMARTALAVERYRLAKGHLPERLEELVSAFLERVPVDPWNGGNALSYRIKENGEFVVYSFANNKIDQKGQEMQNWWSNGDMTFTVAPPELRDRPQVVEEG